MTRTEPSAAADVASKARQDPGPALPDVRMHLHTPANPGEGVVVSNERCTGKKAAGYVRHVAIDVSATQLAGNWRSGQSFGVIPPGVDASGKPHKLRLYSIAAPTAGEDGKGKIISTTVKRTIDEHWESGKLFLGVCSNYLCDLSPGDRVQVTGPAGKRFVLPADPAAHDYVFFATGTGIAPFRGMLMDLFAGAAGSTSRIALVMGVPFAGDLLYHDWLCEQAAARPNFRYITALSRMQQLEGGPAMYVQDRLAQGSTRDELAALLAGPRTLVYICGLAGMELGIFQKMAAVLPPAALEQYLRADAALLAAPGSWERSMLNKQVQISRRVFLEVY